MNPQDQKMLDDILAKNKNSLTMEDLNVLRARRDYLTEAQVKEYGVEEEAPKKPETGNDEGKDESIDLEELKSELEKMTVKELQDVCKESKIEYTGNKTQLINRILGQNK